MSDLLQLPASILTSKIRAQEVSAEEYIRKCYERIGKVEKRIHAFITLTENLALEKAREVDAKIRSNRGVGSLAGVAVAVKDNICTLGVRTTCASKMLESFTPPYDATVVERLKSQDAVIIGKTNMDEFAMGSSTEHSRFGPTRNPYDLSRVPGGSSGGSAAAVASLEATLALGSDTGGSVRCPASFCNLVGLKPTYGLVSRYGLIAYANSLEQISPITRCVADAALLTDVIAGHDHRDSTSIGAGRSSLSRHLVEDVAGMKIGVPQEFFGRGTDRGVSKAVWKAITKLEELGASYTEIKLECLDYALASYYIIAMSEASSNLARYDGLRYGFRLEDDGYDWSTAFSRNRRSGFGAEVKRRIMLGTFALSAGYYDEYYLKAQRVRTLIRQGLEKAFKSFTLLATPTMPILPFRLKEKLLDPLEMYMCDVDTVVANLAGIPAISVPCGSSRGLPVGIQFMAPAFREDLLIRAAYTLEQNLDQTGLKLKI
ncbi:MAG: Asp-tRNA(Asn)/Glu-tRNA(Gln) amidotransferase subunit GatA [Candidatus Bathyarchaeia archaeon]